jgi:hypothetical protein
MSAGASLPDEPSICPPAPPVDGGGTVQVFPSEEAQQSPAGPQTNPYGQDLSDSQWRGWVTSTFGSLKQPKKDAAPNSARARASRPRRANEEEVKQRIRKLL